MAVSSIDRYTFLYLARVAEESERYDDMVVSMKKLASLDVELSAEERNVLCAAYQNAIRPRRASWRVICSTEQKEAETYGNNDKIERIRDYRSKIESEITNICNDVIKLLDEHLLPFSSSIESTVFYYKLKGDYYRYKAEIKTGDERKEAGDESVKAYEAGIVLAESELRALHPLRLSLALNYSVFYYEVMDSIEGACLVAKEAYDEAITELDGLNKVPDEHSRLIMKLLRNNIALWKKE